MSLCKEIVKINAFKKSKTLTLEFQKTVFEQQFYSCLLFFFKSIQQKKLLGQIWAVGYHNSKKSEISNLIKEFKTKSRPVSKIGLGQGLDHLYCLNSLCSLWHSFVLDTLIRCP